MPVGGPTNTAVKLKALECENRSFKAVELATLTWVDRFNHRRLLEPIGNIPPAEAEERCYAMLKEPAMAA